MRCPNWSPGSALRAARERHGLTQRRLALRAGTSQDAISRIERGVESPTFERFRELLLAMGEQPSLEAVPLAGVPKADGVAAAKALSPRERLLESASWNLVATRLEIAGADARRAGHPATRRASS
jgi:transcriptional regulator with XRE-family HTH domain